MFLRSEYEKERKRARERVREREREREKKDIGTETVKNHSEKNRKGELSISL